MKRRAAFPHTITVHHLDVTGTDGRNNTVRTETGTIDDLPARVDIVDDREDRADRDRTIELVEVETAPRWHGTDVVIPAQDTFDWNGHNYELIGPAARDTDHLGRAHLVRLTGRRIVG